MDCISVKEFITLSISIASFLTSLLGLFTAASVAYLTHSISKANQASAEISADKMIFEARKNLFEITMKDDRKGSEGDEEEGLSELDLVKPYIENYCNCLENICSLVIDKKIDARRAKLKYYEMIKNNVEEHPELYVDSSTRFRSTIQVKKRWDSAV